MTENWHGAMIKKMRTLSLKSLYYTKKDATEAAIAAESLGNAVQAGRYIDEALYAAQEIKRRQDKR